MCALAGYQGPTLASATAALEVGIHQLVVEYFNAPAGGDATQMLVITDTDTACDCSSSFGHDPAGPCNDDCASCNSDQQYCTECYTASMPVGGVCPRQAPQPDPTPPSPVPPPSPSPPSVGKPDPSPPSPSPPSPSPPPPISEQTRPLVPPVVPPVCTGAAFAGEAVQRRGYCGQDPRDFTLCVANAFVFRHAYACCVLASMTA